MFHENLMFEIYHLKIFVKCCTKERFFDNIEVTWITSLDFYKTKFYFFLKMEVHKNLSLGDDPSRVDESQKNANILQC